MRGDRRTAGSSTEPRIDGLDWIKAVGIVTVVFIHGFFFWGLRRDALWDGIGVFVNFAVPGFFFAAGYLAYRAAEKAPEGFWGRRMQRVLWPYVVASFLAVAFQRLVLHRPIAWSDFPFQILTGSAWGIYYFVPLLIGATLMAPLLGRWPVAALCLWAVFFVLPIANAVGWPPVRLGSLFAEFRNPVRWWGYYLSGWLCARFALHTWLTRSAVRPVGVFATALAAAAIGITGAVWVGPRPFDWERAIAEYVARYSIIACLFALGAMRPASGAVRWLSHNSYPLYLYHYFFLELFWLVTGKDGFVPRFEAFLLTLVATVAWTRVGQWLLGARARTFLG